MGEFIVAVNKCIGEISVREAEEAIFKYDRELTEAAQFEELIGSKKVISHFATAKKWMKDRKFAVVGLTNGCFDILHAGHIQLLREARAECDYLVVLMNSNKSVQTLKGAGRPINHEIHRAVVLSALEMVDMVFVFEEARINRWLLRLKPNVWFKGGDYTIQTLNQDEVRAATSVNCKIRIIPQRSLISTTKIYEKVRHAERREMDQSHRPPGTRSRKVQRAGSSARRRV